MNDTLRRWCNPLYRRAHRYQFPSRQDVMVFLLCFVAIGAASIIGHDYTMRQAAKGAQAQRTEILACLNGKASLGTYQSHGETWAVMCSTYERRVKP